MGLNEPVVVVESIQVWTYRVNSITVRVSIRNEIADFREKLYSRDLGEKNML